jgi:hypothetical protein
MRGQERRVVENGVAMEHNANDRPQAKVQIDRMLENAVILSWEDLPHDFETGLVHIEYVPGMALDYLKIWQLVAKGAWNLICEYWMVPQPATASSRLTFSNGYHSEGLSQMLEVIMQNQRDFLPSESPGRGLVQVGRPSNEDKQTASACMKQAYNHLRLEFGHMPAVAAA